MQQNLEFRLANITLRGIGFGDPDKPMLVALHGWLDNGLSFLPLSKHLSEFYIVALDMAGHGLSEHRPVGAHYHITDYVHDLHELVVSQGWSSFLLIGHSLGGIVASLYAACFASYVDKLVLIESFGAFTKDATSGPEQLAASIQSRLKVQSSKARHPKSLDSTIQARMLNGDVGKGSAALLISRNTAEKDGKLRFTSDRRLRTLSTLRFTEEQAEAFLRAVTCPVLAIKGTQGYGVISEWINHRSHWISDLRVVECEGRHHLHMDNASKVAEKINAFL